MRKKADIKNRIKGYEEVVGELLDKQEEDDDIFQIEAYQTMIEIYRRNIKQLMWVLNV